MNFSENTVIVRQVSQGYSLNNNLPITDIYTDENNRNTYKKAIGGYKIGKGTQINI